MYAVNTLIPWLLDIKKKVQLGPVYCKHKLKLKAHAAECTKTERNKTDETKKKLWRGGVEETAESPVE